MNLLLLESSEIGTDQVATVEGPRARHLRLVLRATIGRPVRIGIVDGPTGTGTVLTLDDERATLQCVFEAAPPAIPAVDLLLALPRPKVLQRLWAQIAALGVGRILLTNAERVERNYFDTHVLDPVVYRPLLIEGLQQARDTRVPVVSIHRQFRILVEDELDGLCPQSTRLMADPEPYATEVTAAPPRPPGAAAPATADVSARTLLAVGPEGGWNDFERRLLEVRGFRRVSLGARALRSDTACIALLTLASAGVWTGRPDCPS
jgi:RsmE family RNA methyltransferase